MRSILLTFALMATSPISNAQSSSDQALTIPLNNWTSQRVLSLAIGEYLSTSGINVDYVNISSEDQWGAMGRGAVHFQLEVWEPSMKSQFERYLSQGKIVDLGEHSATVIEDWWYPKYIEKLCPELPKWQALISCKSLFLKNNDKTMAKAVYYGGPWDYGDADIIRALGLEFTIERKPTDSELWQQLAQSVKSEAPIILLNWSPNWTDKYIEGEFIRFPAYSKSCESDPSWGLNKQLTKDCGNKRHGWLKKVASSNFSTAFPCAHQLIKNISFTREMVADASAFVVVDKLHEKKAASAWIVKYKTELANWSYSTCL